MSRRRKHDATGRSQPSEHFTKLLRSTMEEPAWRALSSTAQALYPWLKLEWRGPQANNNGKIRLSARQAAERMGVSKPDTAAEAFRDLQRKGFIVVTEPACLGIGGAAKAPAFEITELKVPGDDGPEGRKLYRDWRPGKDFPVHATSANNPRGINGQKTKPCPENRDSTIPKIGMTKGVLIPKIGMDHPENRDKNDGSGALAIPKIGTSLSTSRGSAFDDAETATPLSNQKGRS